MESIAEPQVGVDEKNVNLFCRKCGMPVEKTDGLYGCLGCRELWDKTDCLKVVKEKDGVSVIEAE